MTDNEIIKALECCIKSSHFGECFENRCPMVSEKGCKVGKETLYPYALDLINRQKAEIERLEKELKETLKEFTDIMSEQNKTNEKVIRRLKCMRDVRAEAIKEFAERMKQYLLLNRQGEMSVISFENIENLVKEMVGAE